VVVAETPDTHAPVALPGRRAAAGHLRRERVLLALIAIVGVSIVLRIVLAAFVRGPFVFTDELGYHRLAYSLGVDGKLALFDQEGFSYSPLYSLLLAPIYALGASAPTAYEWGKVVNAIVMSLAVIPVYGIARFVLPRRESLVVAALSAAAPLMYYTALGMSESVAYPLFLAAVWAMLVAIRTSSLRADAVVLAAVLAATAARIQLIVLFPVALTAAVLAQAIVRDGSAGIARRVGRSVRQHWLLFAVGGLVAAGAAIGKIAGEAARPVVGRYADVGIVDFPSGWDVLELSLHHLAGLDLAVGVIPFVGALVAAYVFVTRGAGRDAVVFASVAVSATVWLLLETGYVAAAFAGSDYPRIHERYLFYLVPLFLVALLAALRLRDTAPPFGVLLGAGAAAALLPAVIPFDSIINITIIADSFALQMYSENARGTIVPVEHAKLNALTFAALLALVPVVLRRRPPGVVAAVLLVFVLLSVLVGARMIGAGRATEAVFSGARDWVDRTKPPSDVVLIGRAGATDEEAQRALRQTAFHNLSITRLYYLCERVFGAGNDFGEQMLSVDAAGRLRDGTQQLRARYAVASSRLGLRGRVVARNRDGGLVLVAIPGRGVSVLQGRPTCP
jgi:hypothetical protein